VSSSYLAIGYECNHRCCCCPLTTYDRLHERLSYDDIKRIVGLIRQKGETAHIVLSGGEPMLHPDFLRILDFVASSGFYVTVLSNASLCRKREYVKAIKDVMPENRFDIITAIHSSTPAIHDKITGIQGSLMETLEGLDYLVEEGIPLTLKHIFNRISLSTLMDTFQYLEGHFPPKVSFQFCMMDYSGRAEKNRKELFVSLDEIQQSLEPVLDYLETRMAKKRSVSFIETPLCLTDPYYWKYFGAVSDGLAAYIAPNTDDRDIEYEVSSQCGAFYEPCESCVVQKWCAGIWKSAYRYGGTGLLRPVRDKNLEKGESIWTK